MKSPTHYPQEATMATQEHEHPQVQETTTDQPRTREQVALELEQARSERESHRGNDKRRFTRRVKELEAELASMPEPVQRTRSDVIADLVAKATERREAMKADDGESLSIVNAEILGLVDELVDAPATLKAKSAKPKTGVVDMDRVVTVLRESSEPMAAEQILEAIGCPVSAATKARIAFWSAREGKLDVGVREHPKSGKQPARYEIKA